MRCANDLGAWERLDPWSGLAVKLVSLDIERLPDVLGYLAEADPSLTDKLEQIREILLANWVEIEAVQGLIQEGRRPCGERRKALILNAPEEEGERLAKLYLRRAFGPNGWWTLAPITGIIGETNDLADAASQLADEIEAALVRAISAINRERAYRVLRYYTDKGNPVVVTAAMPSSVSVLLPNLMTSFDFATFLWRRDIDAPANEQLPEENFRLLTPVVSREKYAKFTLIDDVLRDRLNRGSVGNRP